MTGTERFRDCRAVLLGLYSKDYPAIGESHGLSVVAGSLAASIPASILDLHVLDMVEWGEEDPSRAADLLRRTKANVLAIGLPYGTFTTIRSHYQALRSAIHDPHPLVVFGGPIATYLSDQLLDEIDSDAIVIIGEAEDTLPLLVKKWMRKESYRDVPNLHYIAPTGEKTRTPRRLVDLQTAKRPYRDHLRDIYARGGQVFIEASRGCSWAACTFCLRGLTDVEGRSHEYRRKSPQYVAMGLNDIAELGIRDATFADEDFLGGDLTEAEEFVNGLAASMAEYPRMDASLTVHSVYSRKDDPMESERRRLLLNRLADMGFQKIFLGIESCSPSQLKRYAKGHTREEAVAAFKRLEALGIRVEIGVILFDPLCSLDEVKESLRFMREHGMAALASGLSSHLRLQTDSHYLTLLRKHEQRSGRRIHWPDLDPDTLSFGYDFLDPQVGRLFDGINQWNRRLHPIYYPAKSLSRSGGTGMFGPEVHPLRTAVAEFRNDQCDAMLTAIEHLERGHDPASILRKTLSQAATTLASSLRKAISTLGPDHARHPVVIQASKAACLDWMDDSRS
jgi:Radical SAM superfamily